MFECGGGETSWHPAVHHICMWLRSTVCLRAGMCERSLQMCWKWVPRAPPSLQEGGELCVTGTCVGSGSRGQHWLCDRAALERWRTRGAQAVRWPRAVAVSERMELYQPYVCIVVFSTLASAVLVRCVTRCWACELSHLPKFTALTSSTRFYLASLLELLCYCICK